MGRTVETERRLRLNSEALHKHLREHRISRDALSRNIGVSPSTIWRVDEGHTEPSAKVIAGLLTETGLPFERLFLIEQTPA